MDRRQLAQLSPGDAVVALRSYVRRAGELFRSGELGPTGLALTRPAPSGWSLAALLRTSEAYLSRLDRALADVLHQDRPVLAASLLQRPSPEGGQVSTDASPPDGEQLLGRLGGALNALAERVASVPAKDWTRQGRLGEEPVDAHELLREAVAFGRTLLDELAATVTHLRRAP